ncbi:HlyD family efflux transporter periplasmic adaptor subunit [Ferruginibacter sp. SUN106]|uniref:HlyD family efflux transporter periplasmic adaptor subunit n=1 Tax=Ferruginibacter sp. SUN106 TaxID=2978348 RepID=UPI003D3660C5
MPGQNNQTPLYNDLDEVLNKPPKRLVRYGNMLLLLVIIMVCCISLIVKHEDIIGCSATILPEHFAIIRSPQIKTTVEKFYLKRDTLLHKGDTIVVLKPGMATGADSALSNVIAITTPYDCKVLLRRMPQQGEILQPATSLVSIAGAQNKFDVQLEIPEAYIQKVQLGSAVKFNGGFLSGGLHGEPVCTIISTPYFDTISKKMIADARLVFISNNNTSPKPNFIFKQTMAAGIVSGKKSLAAAFTEFH